MTDKETLITHGLSSAFECTKTVSDLAQLMDGNSLNHGTPALHT